MAVYNVTDYGALGDGVANCGSAIAAAIDACEAGGGGTVYIPAGVYLTGRVVLASFMTLELEAGATLRFTPDFDVYPPVRTRWSGYECYGFSPLLYGSELKHVSIRGKGVLDGQGQAWWDAYRALRHQGQLVHSFRTEEIAKLNEELLHSVKNNIVEWASQFLRPPLLHFIHCEEITIEGVTLQNSPFWNTHLVYCNNVHIHGITVRNPPDAPNGDGIDLDSCSNVRISDCTFDVGDDCLCIKSGIDEDGRRVGIPSENIVITNCTMLRGHGGVVFGSEMAGGIRNVVVTGCLFIGTDRGIRMKTNRARGGYIRNVRISNIHMEDVACPITINSFYRHGIDESNPLLTTPEAAPITEGTPIVEGIHMSSISATGCRSAAGFFYGLPEMPIRDVRLNDISIQMTTDPDELGTEPDMVKEQLVMAGDGFWCRHVQDLSFLNVRIDTRQGPALRLEQASCIEVDVTTKRMHEGTPIVDVIQSERVTIRVT